MYSDRHTVTGRRNYPPFSSETAIPKATKTTVFTDTQKAGLTDSKHSKRITFCEFVPQIVLVRLCLRPIIFTHKCVAHKEVLPTMKHQNRTRDVQLILRVTPQEHEHIKKKMALMKTNNFNAYARKMLIDGYVIEVDLSKYHELAGEVNKIGVNINQIARMANETRSVSVHQIDRLQQEVEQIWQLLKSSLSELQSASR